jgi:CubicO group peptidase (beta-lactamase class C family)
MNEAGVIAILDEAVAARVFPGGQLVAGDGGAPVLRLAFGRNARPGDPVTPDTFYDVASLTKACVTSLLTLLLVADRRLDWDTPAARFVPEAPAEITVRHLLAHASGLPAWRPLYERLHGEPRDTIVRLAAAEPLERPPGEASVYSDLGFIVLGAVVERAGGARLDELAARRLFEPLAMQRSRFVDLAAGWRPEPVAATEGSLRGEVHDENCRAAGGVLGHAGLFSTADDLSLLAAALLRSWHGAGPFPHAPLRTLFSPCGVPGSTWRLGWDGPAATGSQAGELWPKDGVGHLGFTGCSLWLDPPRSRWVVLLTNRVHPSREDTRIKQVRPRVMDAVVTLLGRSI